MVRARRLATVALVVALATPAVGACDADPGASRGPDATPPADGATPTGASGSKGPRVLAVSVDGLNPSAITQLGEAGTPTLHRLLREGAGTLNARTEVEQTVTLPNHTSMITGRRITAAAGGHGVTWNDERPGTVSEAAGHPVASIFTEVRAHGGSTALYASKEKFELFERSWPDDIDESAVTDDPEETVALAREDLEDGAPTFTFLHISLPDGAGHAYGGMSPEYLEAVRRTDQQLASILTVVDADAQLRRHLVVVLTADHGFAPGSSDHSDSRNLQNYRIPFLVWGAGVAEGDLYALNPDYRDPGRRQPTYAGKQPIRNGDVAELAADLLGLGDVDGSTIGSEQGLDVTR